MKLNKSFIFVFFLAILLVPAAVLAQGEPPPIPDPVGHVNDYAEVCSVSQKEQLESTLVALKTDTGIEVAVTTLQDCGDDPQAYRLTMFNEWSIGNAEEDNGLLILACIDQRTLEQEVGYGLEPTIPDVYTNRSAEQYFVPRAQSGDLCGGLTALVDAYDPVLRGDEFAHSVSTAEGDGGEANATSIVTLIFIIFIVVLLITLFIAMLSEGSGSYSSSSDGGYSGGFYSFGGSSGRSSSGPSSFSSSSSGSSGGFNFGGGSSGGAGSSTGW